MNKNNKIDIKKTVTFIAVFVLSSMIFHHWDSIEKFVISIFK